MTQQKSHPKLLDVARQAGVSPATVSRVLHNSAPVRASVRARVLAAIKALEYEQPSARPSSTSSYAVAVVLPDVLNPFFTEIVRGVQDEANLDSSMIMLLDTLEDPQRELQALRVVANRPVSGIIVCASRLSGADIAAVYDRHKIPMLVINRNVDRPEIPCVVVDYMEATFRATRHLIALNHSRIAYLAGPSTSEPSQARRRGIETALAEAGLVLKPEQCLGSLPTIDGGFQAMSALLALPVEERPTAAIAYNDIMALGALHAARVHHLRVPDDISVVGFDDIEMAAHSNPPLTTVSQPKYRMGRLAMKILRQFIQGAGASGDGYTLLESSLVVRESTGLAPGTTHGQGIRK